MAHDGADMPNAILPDLLDLTEAALPPVEALLAEATTGLRAQVERDGRVSGAALEEHQFAALSLIHI